MGRMGVMRGMFSLALIILIILILSHASTLLSSANDPDRESNVVLKPGCLEKASAAIVGQHLLIVHATSCRVQPLYLELAGRECHLQGDLTGLEAGFGVLVVAVEPGAHIYQGIPGILNQGADADADR